MNNLTELVFIIDASGSMSGLVDDTVGGFNTMIARQKEQDGECLVSLVTFNHTQSVILDRARLSEVKPLTRDDYTPMGSTALCDALGGAIHHMGNVHKYAREEDRPSKTVFIVTTDGMENSSRRYCSDDVKAMVRRQQEKYGWEFLFLGANMDAVETAARYGIRADRAARYNCDSEGIGKNYESLGKAVSDMRGKGSIDDAWSVEIKLDYETRKK